MQRTYWQRIVLLLISFITLTLLFLTACQYNFWRCVGGNDILVVRTAFHFFGAIFVTGFMFIFVSDSVFKKWLKFTGIWFFITTIMIILSPEYQGGWLGIGPEKESVSIFMSVLFVIVSLVKLVWDVRKEK